MFGEWDVEEDLSTGLDSKLGIRVHLPGSPDLKQSSASWYWGRSIGGRLLDVRVGRGYRKIGG